MNLHTPQAIFLSGLLLYLTIRAVYQKRATGSPAAVTRSNQLDRFLIFLVVLGQVALPLLYIFSPWLNFANYEATFVTIWPGAIVWSIGLYLFWRSHSDLGQNWSVSLELHSAHELVSKGVYRFVRHPMYSAFFVLAIAQGLLLPNWLAGGVALLSVKLMCLIRIPKEEAMMCTFFGQEYHEYMRRTGNVIPGVGLRKKP